MNSANHHEYRGVVKLEYAFSFAERPILCVRSSLAVPGSMTNVVRDGLGSWLRKMRRPVCPVPAPTAIKQVQGGGLVLSGTTGTARPSTVGVSGPIEGTTLGPRDLASTARTGRNDILVFPASVRFLNSMRVGLPRLGMEV